jgi:hypothetical protein
MHYERGCGVSSATGDLAYARMSRRQFVSRSAVAVGRLAGLDLLRPSFALSASGADPTPIPGGFKLSSFTPVPANPDIHVLPPALGFDVSTITDFSGFVAAANVKGSAMGCGSSFAFDADMRAMQGTYVGHDGASARAASASSESTSSPP